MPGLSDTQTRFLRGIFGAAPDAAVSSLQKALSAEANTGSAMSRVYELVAEEAVQRRVRNAVFGPLVAVCRPGPRGPRRFPSGVVAALWEGLRVARPEQALLAQGACVRAEDNAYVLYDELCVGAAAGLREGQAAFASAVGALGPAGSDAVDEFARYLDLAPLARDGLARLPEWIGRLTEERGAAARLAYKDAVAFADDAGPRYFEILYANLAEPWLILRVLSAVMDRPADAYVASSELARFGEYILDDIDRRLADFNRFNPDLGREAGLAAGETIRLAAEEINEFETSIELSREGPWGKRLIKQRQTMASLAEARYAMIEKALDQALPLQLVRFGTRLRGHPKLAVDPDPRLLLRAEGLLGFFDHSRAYASQSGFGAARAKAAEAVEARLDTYVEDLLEMLRAEEIENPDRIRAYLEAAAELVQAIRGAKAAQIIRRRAAA